MQIEFLITLATMIIGFLGVFIMLFQLMQQLNTKIDTVEAKLEARINALEARFEADIKELRGLIIGLYQPKIIEFPRKESQQQQQ